MIGTSESRAPVLHHNGHVHALIKNCTNRISTVFWIFSLCATKGPFTALSRNWVCGIATVFHTVCACGISSTCAWGTCSILLSRGIDILVSVLHNCGNAESARIKGAASSRQECGGLVDELDELQLLGFQALSGPAPLVVAHWHVEFAILFKSCTWWVLRCASKMRLSTPGSAAPRCVPRHILAAALPERGSLRSDCRTLSYQL